MNKKCRALHGVSLVFVIVLMLLFGTAAVSASTTMKTKKAAYLRTGPSSSSAKIVKIPKGKKVTAGVQDGSYTKIVYKGSKTYGGWFPTKYLKSAKSSGSSSSSSSSSSSTTTRTLATAIWLRTGPGTNYSRIRAIEGGESVTVHSLNGTWYHVSYHGATGYIRQGYFVNETPIREVATAVYMRTAPTKSASVITVVPALAKVSVLARTSNNWCKVNYNGRTGYIYGGYFTTDSDNGQTVRITSTAIYLRSSTDVSSTRNVIAVVPAGAEVTIVSQVSTRFYLVRYGSTTGYMRSGYFR